jgi:hypothetical protein
VRLDGTAADWISELGAIGEVRERRAQATHPLADTVANQGVDRGH